MSNFGQALREAASDYGVTQKEIAAIANTDRSLVSHIIRHARKPGKQFVMAVTPKIDHPKLYLEAVREVTGGAFYFGWLDGEQVDLNPCNIEKKFAEEVDEVFKVIEGRKAGVKFEASFKDKQEAIKYLLELVDVAHVCCMNIAVGCRQLEVSPTEIFIAHEQKLVDRGYKKKTSSYATARG